MSTALTPARPSGRDPAIEFDLPAAELADELDAKRGAIVRHCTRMLGTGSDAEDATQETMVRAWRGRDRFEGRASLQTWLYAIATNVCLTMLRSADRRPRPVDVDGVVAGRTAPSMRSSEHSWMLATLSPSPDGHGDPADRAVAREDVQHAVTVVLDLLPPRQRAVLFLRDVCSWRAREVAELLESSVTSVNSALQRAHAALHAAAAESATGTTGSRPTSLLARYVDALERADVPLLVALAHADARGSSLPG